MRTRVAFVVPPCPLPTIREWISSSDLIISPLKRAIGRVACCTRATTTTAALPVVPTVMPCHAIASFIANRAIGAPCRIFLLFAWLGTFIDVNVCVRAHTEDLNRQHHPMGATATQAQVTRTWYRVVPHIIIPVSAPLMARVRITRADTVWWSMEISIYVVLDVG